MMNRNDLGQTASEQFTPLYHKAETILLKHNYSLTMDALHVLSRACNSYADIKAITCLLGHIDVIDPEFNIQGNVTFIDNVLSLNFIDMEMLDYDIQSITVYGVVDLCVSRLNIAYPNPLTGETIYESRVFLRDIYQED